MEDTRHIHIRDGYYLCVGSLTASTAVLANVNKYIDDQQNRIRGYDTHRCILGGCVIFTTVLFIAIAVAKAIIGNDATLEEASSWLTPILIADGIITIFLGVAISSTMQFQDTETFFTLNNMTVRGRPATIIYLRDVSFDV